MKVATNELIFILDHGDGPEPVTGDAEFLGRILRDRACGFDTATLLGVYALNAAGAPVLVSFTETGAGRFDDNDMAYPVVTVTMPDRTIREAVYAVDGRA